MEQDGETAYKPSDIFKQLDSVSLSQRSLAAEFGRQHTRLIHVLRWYDHQKIACGYELRRQMKVINNEIRRQSTSQSKFVLRERARLKHILDADDENKLPPISSLPHRKSHLSKKETTLEHKRKVYGCLLTQFKAPLRKTAEKWPQFQSDSFFSPSDVSTKSNEKQRVSISKYLPSPLELQTRKTKIINKCLYEFEECDVSGYDHFLQTSEPNRNAQILAQQILHDKNQNKYK